MEYQHYVARKRVKHVGISGAVNIPYGTELTACNNLIEYHDLPICATTSRSAHEFFSQNDDGNGLARGKLVQSINEILTKNDAKHQDRWDKVWDDPVCQKYKRMEHDDYWLWNHDFYNAGLDDLRYIAKLVGVKEVF